MSARTFLWWVYEAKSKTQKNFQRPKSDIFLRLTKNFIEQKLSIMSLEIFQNYSWTERLNFLDYNVIVKSKTPFSYEKFLRKKCDRVRCIKWNANFAFLRRHCPFYENNRLPDLRFCCRPPFRTDRLGSETQVMPRVFRRRPISEEQ